MKLSSSKKSESILLTILCLVLLFALYYYVVKPKMDEVSSMKNSISTTEQEIQSVKEQIASLEQTNKEASGVNEFMVRKLLPANREIEQLLLNFEEIEYVTGTRIDNINFNNYDTVVATSTLRDPNAPETTEGDGETTETEETAEQGTDETDADQSEETEETAEEGDPVAPVSSIAVETLPPDLKLITFDISIQAPSKKELLAFIKEVEKLERIVHIDEISYELEGEEALISKETPKAVGVRLLLTTFYYD